MTTLSEFLADGPDARLMPLFEAIERGAQRIQREVGRAGLGADVWGAQGVANVQGEQQQKLDLVADLVFEEELKKSSVVAGMASEERYLATHFDAPGAEFVVLIDPLDGSSNIDVNVAIGTIFAVYQRLSPRTAPLENTDFLQTGRAQVAAGYVSYSVSTQLVFTTGRGVQVFTLHPDHGRFHLVRPSLTTPAEGTVYSINEVNLSDFEPRWQRYAAHCKTKRNAAGKRQYTARYIGSLVADFHRNLLKGGLYLYPATADAPAGRLRLLYECNPMAFLAEQAGGEASNGQQPILDVVPKALHERSALVIGSATMVREALSA